MLPAYRGNYPVHIRGLLFTNGKNCSKGELLVAYLKKIGERPGRVIFVDDKEDNLKSAESALLNYDQGIDFLGLHYLGANSYPSRPISAEEFGAKWEAFAAEALVTD
jgi:hypothetical protein